MSAGPALRLAVESALPQLLTLGEADVSVVRAPATWSKKQILGHLIDSASNNHQRFVRAQFTDDLLFPGYDQDAWVFSQRYQDAPWLELVPLFRLFNLHIARVIEAIPEEVRMKPRVKHNLHQLAFIPVLES